MFVCSGTNFANLRLQTAASSGSNDDDDQVIETATLAKRGRRRRRRRSGRRRARRRDYYYFIVGLTFAGPTEARQVVLAAVFCRLQRERRGRGSLINLARFRPRSRK